MSHSMLSARWVHTLQCCHPKTRGWREISTYLPTYSVYNSQLLTNNATDNNNGRLTWPQYSTVQTLWTVYTVFFRPIFNPTFISTIVPSQALQWPKLRFSHFMFGTRPNFFLLYTQFRDSFIVVLTSLFLVKRIKWLSSNFKSVLWEKRWVYRKISYYNKQQLF